MDAILDTISPAKILLADILSCLQSQGRHFSDTAIEDLGSSILDIEPSMK